MKVNIEKLKAARKDKGWSQELLAKTSGLSIRTIQRIEADAKASAESMLSLCAALELSVNELQTSSDTINVNWSRKSIMQSFIGFIILSSAIGMLFYLGGQANFFIDLPSVIYLFAFTYACTIISFGIDGFFRSLSSLKLLFTNQIRGGKPAIYLATIYQSQISFCYAGAILAVLIGSVGIHSSYDASEPTMLHATYAVNILVFVYAAIYCECLIRPLKTKLASCDIAE